MNGHKTDAVSVCWNRFDWAKEIRPGLIWWFRGQNEVMSYIAIANVMQDVSIYLKNIWILLIQGGWFFNQEWSIQLTVKPKTWDSSPRQQYPPPRIGEPLYLLSWDEPCWQKHDHDNRCRMIHHNFRCSRLCNLNYFLKSQPLIDNSMKIKLDIGVILFRRTAAYVMTDYLHIMMQHCPILL